MEDLAQERVDVAALRIEVLQAAAQEYAAIRADLVAKQQAILKAVATSPQWNAWFEADTSAKQAKANLDAIRSEAEQTNGLPATMDAETKAKQRLEAAWHQAAPHNPKKTWGTTSGEVQVRVTRGVEVKDAKALCEDLLARRLFDYVKDVKVDAKHLRVLMDGREPPKGLVVADTVAVAYTPAGTPA